MMTDPISDMLTRIRNAGIARQTQTTCPFSKQKLAIAKVLEAAGFIRDVCAESQEGHLTLVMTIRYDDHGKPLIDGIRRVSKPGRRVCASLLLPHTARFLTRLRQRNTVLSDS